MSNQGWRMWDFIYIAGTIGFFGLMLLYVRACAALGRRESEEERR